MDKNYINLPALVFFGLFFAAIIYFGIISARRRKMRLVEFVKKNGYSFSDLSYPSLPGLESEYLQMTFQEQPYKYFRNVISGVRGQKAIRMFDYFNWHSKNIKIIQSVLETPQTTSSPLFIVLRRTIGGSRKILLPKKYVALSIDGELNRFVEIFALPENQHAVVSFLSSERQGSLLDVLGRTKSIRAHQKKIHGFEITPHKLYVFRYMFNSPEQIEETFEAADNIVSVLNSKF